MPVVTFLQSKKLRQSKHHVRTRADADLLNRTGTILPTTSAVPLLHASPLTRDTLLHQR